MNDDLIGPLADNLRRRIKNRGRDGSNTVNEIRAVDKWEFTGYFAPRRTVMTGPAVVITLGNRYRIGGTHLRVLLYQYGDELVATLITTVKDKMWVGGDESLGAVDLNDPDMFDKLARVLARIGIDYRPVEYDEGRDGPEWVDELLIDTSGFDGGTEDD